MKAYLLLAALVFGKSAPEPWPVGARAEAYLAERAGLHRTADLPLYPARTRLNTLFKSCALPARLTPNTSLGLHYKSSQGWGEADVYIYTFTRPAALDSAYYLLSTRLEACVGSADCGCQPAQPQQPFRHLHIARSQAYLLLFDGNELTHEYEEFLPLADAYADLLD